MISGISCQTSWVQGLHKSPSRSQPAMSAFLVKLSPHMWMDLQRSAINTYIRTLNLLWTGLKLLQSDWIIQFIKSHAQHYVFNRRCPYWPNFAVVPCLLACKHPHSSIHYYYFYLRSSAKISRGAHFNRRWLIDSTTRHKLTDSTYK